MKPKKERSKHRRVCLWLFTRRDNKMTNQTPIQTQNTNSGNNQLQNQIINHIILALEKLVMQFIQNLAPNKDMTPDNDN